ncbi:MAG: MoxR family ATPase [Gammaproteobacteria bacterium]|nr:MoxR family ATPase [Gammaproteobacteria bacterium]
MQSKNYRFRLVNADREGPLEDKSMLYRRPSGSASASFAKDARRFLPGRQLEDAINTAIAVNEPLLITGEPGAGKTQMAYYVAYKLDIEPVIHFQVKSDSTAKDLLYHFDTVRYFHDAHLRGKDEPLNKKDYVEHRALWDALIAEEPRAVLIDEIDKAPRDFPNDLLHELDKLEFTVLETGETVRGKQENRPMVFITSNSERRLPEPFLRRCVYHHIPFDRDLVWRVVERRMDEYPALDEDFLRMAVDRFLRLREAALRKRPGTGELLVWLRVLGLNTESYSQNLDEDLSKLPYLGVLIKDHQDMDDLGHTG